MGLAERDYARVDSGWGAGARGVGGGSGGPRGRPGQLGGAWLSINTWIIGINIAIFLLGVSVLRQPVRVGWGEFTNPSVSANAARSAQVDRSTTKPMPGTGWLFYHPRYIAPDAQGRQVVDLTTGRPLEAGGERFTFRPVLDAWGHFSTGKAFTELQIWRFITFQFLHANLTHLVLNMLGLHFVGGLVEQYLGRRRYAAFYLTCGVMGAAMYLLLNLAAYMLPQGIASSLPLLLVSDPYTPLVGASAGVFGVLLAAAFLAPREIVQVMFVLPMKLKTAVYLFLLLAVLNLVRGGQNAGGDAAHVGGAIAGYYLIRHTQTLRDILATFGFADGGAGRAARGSSGSSGASGVLRPSIAQREQAEVDRILDKVRASGLSSLNELERRTLRDASRAL